MTQNLSSFRRAGLALIFLVAVDLQSASATMVFDDHFTGNSGGIPANWTGQGTIVESGTTVTLHGFAYMGTTQTFDPQGGTLTVTAEIVGTNYRAHAGIVDPATRLNQFEFKITVPDGSVDVHVKDGDSGEQEYLAGYLSEYTGGPIRLTAVLTATTFTISTDSPPFSTGPVDYAAAFPTFTRADLGNATALLVVCEALDGIPTFTTYDRITATVDQPTAVERNTLGQIKARYR